MSEILLQFSERVVLATAMQELHRHQQFLRQQLLQSKDGTKRPLLVADLGRLRELDTSALAVLVQLDRESRSQLGQALVIRAAPENLRSLARLSSLESLMSWQQ